MRLNVSYPFNGAVYSIVHSPYIIRRKNMILMFDKFVLYH